MAGLRPSREGGGGACIGRLPPALLERDAAKAAAELPWLIQGESVAPLGAGEGSAEAEGGGVSFDGRDGGWSSEGDRVAAEAEEVGRFRWLLLCADCCCFSRRVFARFCSACLRLRATRSL